MKLSPFVSVAALSVLTFSVRAHAAQKGLVIGDPAEVFQLPSATSSKLGNLPKNSPIRLSNQTVRDMQGEVWYKTRLVSGEFGYVRAKSVRPLELNRDLRDAGLSELATARGMDESDPEKDPGSSRGWIFVLRAMGLGAYESNSKSYGAGGEGEVSVSLLPFAQGYLRRMFSGGVVYQLLPKETVIGGSLIYRLYMETSAEPELRLRVGQGLTSGSLVIGGNFGVRYPFSLDSGAHFSGYLELGGLGSLKAKAPVHVFGSAGVGFHF